MQRWTDTQGRRPTSASASYRFATTPAANDKGKKRSMSRSVDEHRARGPREIGCAVVTVSDTRTLQTDTGGQLAVELLQSAGHQVVHRRIVPDEPEQLRPLIASLVADQQVQALLLTGGTGISQRDHTFEVIRGMLTKELPGYGELFRMLSYQQIGPAAMLSRAVGGVVGKTVVLTMPGSPAGVRLALEQVILPELAHLVDQATH